MSLSRYSNKLSLGLLGTKPAIARSRLLRERSTRGGSYKQPGETTALPLDCHPRFEAFIAATLLSKVDEYVKTTGRDSGQLIPVSCSADPSST